MSNSQKKSAYSFLQINFFSGWQEPLWYKVLSKNLSEERHAFFKKGLLIVSCKLRGRQGFGLVLKITEKVDPEPTFKIREIDSFVKLPNDFLWIDFILQVSNLFFSSKIHLLIRLISFFKLENSSDGPGEVVFNYNLFLEKLFFKLTLTQKEVANLICALPSRGIFSPALLHGVTGSGKSQIYLSLIVSLLKSGKSIIFLVPEVSLAINFMNFFSKELSGFSNIFSWHSGSSIKAENIKLWESINNNKPSLIIGVHLPIFLPIPNLGAIIIDEEHEESFTEAQAPHLNTKQLALIRAKISGIPILFGSATPCSTTYHQAKTDNGWSFFSLTERFSATVAKVELVELNYQRKIFWLSELLISKISERVLKKQQVILFLNRRGFSTITKCKSCGLTFQCKDCSVSLVLHKNEGEILECHYCGLKKEPPFICICGYTSVKHKGLGTEQVCDVLKKKFPQFKILRADKSSIGKKDWPDKINQFAAGEFDILVGTKSVTKGYHFPNVTLVGILWADLDFSFPDYRSTERALQQTLQVSGRSGRGLIAGEVVIQAFEPAVLGGHLKEESYLTFLEKELESRAEHLYPPFSKLIFIQIKDENESVSILKIDKLNAWIDNFFLSNQINAKILGPSTPLIFRQNKLFIQQLMIKIFNNSDLKKSLLFLAKNKLGLNFSYWLEV